MNSLANELRKHVLVITGDPLGKKLAGPGIRALNISEQLSRNCVVQLVTTNTCELTHPNFEIFSVRSNSEMKTFEKWADIIIVQGNSLLDFPFLQKTQKFLVCDLYDPMHLEQLEQGKDTDFSKWNTRIAHANYVLNLQLTAGDLFLVANSRQRDFWMGSLATLGRINAPNYDLDQSLNKLMITVPFGFPSEEPSRKVEPLRGVIKNIEADDKILIWAGGIYNWFNPEILVEAVANLSKRYQNLKLFFMGTQHPHPGVPEMDVIRRTKNLANKLAVSGRNVFFNENWVPYDSRQNYLISADAGVSTHYNHLETRFSFRTRILDYLWAKLPIIATEGDEFAELVEKNEIGVIVPEGDVKSLEMAIEKVLFDSSFLDIFHANIDRVRQNFFWETATRNLVEYCINPHYAADLSFIDRFGNTKRSPLPPAGGVFLFIRTKMYIVRMTFLRNGLSGVGRLIINKLRKFPIS